VPQATNLGSLLQPSASNTAAGIDLNSVLGGSTAGATGSGLSGQGIQGIDLSGSSNGLGAGSISTSPTGQTQGIQGIDLSGSSSGSSPQIQQAGQPGGSQLGQGQTGSQQPQTGGLTGNLGQLLSATSIGGANGAINQNGGIGGLLSNVPNLANLPAQSFGGQTDGGITANGINADGLGSVQAGIPRPSGQGQQPQQQGQGQGIQQGGQAQGIQGGQQAQGQRPAEPQAQGQRPAEPQAQGQTQPQAAPLPQGEAPRPAAEPAKPAAEPAGVSAHIS
jgi:hypothetical protein